MNDHQVSPELHSRIMEILEDCRINAQTLLTEYIAAFGETTTSNKAVADTYRAEIAEIESVLNKMRSGRS